MSAAATRPHNAGFVLNCVGIGLAAGILSSLFGVGGGAVIVPLLVLQLARSYVHVDVRNPRVYGDFLGFGGVVLSTPVRSGWGSR